MSIARPIERIVLHCSATPNGRWNTAADIDQWHRERGFHRAGPHAAIFNPELKAIGYHYVIGTNGAIWTGRHLEEVGAHAINFNQRSIGICMVGTDRFSLEQWDALARLFCALPYALWDARTDVTFEAVRATFNGHGMKVCGHRDLPNVHKSCPGFDAGAWFAKGGPAPEHVLTPEV